MYFLDLSSGKLDERIRDSSQREELEDLMQIIFNKIYWILYKKKLKKKSLERSIIYDEYISIT